MNNRIGLLLKVKDVTAAKFADMIGVQPSNISHILSGRNKPSLDFVIKVCETFPDISLQWLLFGRGNMFQSESEQIVSENKPVETKVEFNERQTQHEVQDLFSGLQANENEISATISDPDVEHNEENELRETKETEIEEVHKMTDEKTNNTIPENKEEDVSQKTNEVKQTHFERKPSRIILVYADETFEILESRN